MPDVRIFLKARHAQPFFARHPWVYAGTIDRIEGDPSDGHEVEVYSHEERFIAHGLYNSRSKIRVRLYSWNRAQLIDRVFFRERLATAIRFREAIGLRGPQKGCRLVFSEADGLSGCTVDEYAGWIAIQFTSLALAQRKDVFADLLEELIQPRGIYIRTEKGVGQLEGLELQDGVLRGVDPPLDLAIEENGLHFFVHLAEGQKTGYYLDQRDNRLETGGLAQSRRVLDAFCYTGGFGLHSAYLGASQVECIDSSAPALALARANASRNKLENVEFIQADVFAHLERRVHEEQHYSLLILDPPKFARTRTSVPDALAGYKRLHSLSMRLLDPDGILVTCCCSGLIGAEMLEELLAEQALKHRREVQILARRGQAPDHPVSTSCRESSYLKCIISRVI